ncbi:MAG: helix-turn-helix transcriptional regulator [Deltaproteobacteria bacterium]|nr:helix-turn-helix transcriptional regulator [Deltaproteobacteria bacterium]
MDRKLNLKKIKSAMQVNGLNQARISKEMGVSRTIVSEWFKGAKFPKPDKLLKLGVTLGLSFNEIVTEISSRFEPVIAFRKKANRKTKDTHLERARDMAILLEQLVGYLPFQDLEHLPTLKKPSLGYSYLQKVALKIRKDVDADPDTPIELEMLIQKFIDLEAVLIPVLWGNKENHENALHIYLPASKTTWIYLNIDSKIHDFKFWIAHELGHVLAPSFEGEDAEDFADAFAQAFLFPENCADRVYHELILIKNTGAKINKIIDYADRHTISPITVYEAINNYASENNLRRVNLGKGFYGATTNFTEKFYRVSETLNKAKQFSAEDYIKLSSEYFGSPFFKTLKEFLSENKKSSGFIQILLETSIIDAKEIFKELTR